VSQELVQAGQPIGLVCQTLNLARSSYYYTQRPPADETQLQAALKEEAGQWPTYGYRRLTRQLERQGLKVNGKRVRRLMNALAITAAKPPKKVETTDSRHHFPRFPNLELDVVINQPDQVWVGDITYIRLKRDFVYLAVLMDVFTRLIRGWELGRSLDQSLTRTALERGLAQHRPAIHHSDQGVQYAATDYVARLHALGVQVSMATVGKPEENPYAERLIRTIKDEEVYLSDYQDFTDAHQQLGRFLDDVYNCKRIHSALGYLTPLEFAGGWALPAA
jgi:transposase InsO family protein